MENFLFSKTLKIIPFGGVDNVTKNMFVYEFGNDIIIVDCGIGFPDEPAPEQELLIPNFDYVVQNRHKVRGLFVTHAHFDHYGAIPYLIEKLNVPIFASRLTQEFILKKLEESHISPKSVDLQTISEKSNTIRIGSFGVTPFHINHSVPEALGFSIKTPYGQIIHVADYKFDWTPVDEEPFDTLKLSLLINDRRPVLLLSDCLGAEKAGHTISEANIQDEFENLILRARGLVLFTTVSTNISRIKQAVQASANMGRKTAFIGRSLEQSAQIARSLGYFANLKNQILPTNKIRNYPYSKLSVVVAGSYGQTDSALTSIAQNKHHLIRLKKNDLVIFSADPSPPGVIYNVNNVLDNLSRLGAKVYYYKIQENLHVSGHGTTEDIKMLVRLVQSKYLMPIGGNYRHMAAYANLAYQMGYEEKKILLLQNSQSIEINQREEIIVK